VNPASDPLAGLRDYHLPEPVPWWPPAPGWWLLLIALLLLASLGAWWLLRRRRCHAVAREAARELERLQAALREDGDAGGFVRGLSRLLRRYALTAFPGEAAAALTGEDWLAFLDAHGGDGRFGAGPGRQLVEAPYRAAMDVATDELAELVRDWIRYNREVCP
jgi:hypothetical protein